MGTDFFYTLPPWKQGDEATTRNALRFWLNLPEWSLDEAADIMVGIDPRRPLADGFALLNGADLMISDGHTAVQHIRGLIDDRRRDFRIVAKSHQLDRETPQKWFDFAARNDLSPDWADLASSMLLVRLPSLPDPERDPEDAQGNDWKELGWAMIPGVLKEFASMGIHDPSKHQVAKKLASKGVLSGQKGNVTEAGIYRHLLSGRKLPLPEN